jgi:hypothetical protein
VRYAFTALALLALLVIGVAGAGDWRSSARPELLEPAIELEPEVRVQAQEQPRRSKARRTAPRIERRKSPSAKTPSRRRAVPAGARGLSPRPAAKPTAGRSSEAGNGGHEGRRAAPARRPAPVVARSGDDGRGASPAPIPPPVPAGNDGDDDGGSDDDDDVAGDADDGDAGD